MNALRLKNYLKKKRKMMNNKTAVSFDRCFNLAFGLCFLIRTTNCNLSGNSLANLSIYCCAIRYFCLTAKSIYFRYAQIRYDINPSRPQGITSALAHIEHHKVHIENPARDLYRERGDSLAYKYNLPFENAFKTPV